MRLNPGNIVHALNIKADRLLNLFKLQNPLARKWVPALVFILALHLFYGKVGIYDRLYERPCSIHASAQSERASVALNYYQQDMNFFKPRILVYNNDDNITGLEFPVIYYAAAVMYKLFGFNDMYLKLLSLIISSGGFLLFYLLVNRFLRNSIFSLLLTGSAMVSPVLMYYVANYMPDAPALGLTLAAWYFFFKYTRSNKSAHLNFFILLATLGALLKVVSLLCFAVIICLLVVDRIKRFRDESGELVFKKSWPIIWRICLGLLMIMAWYAYASWLKKAHHNEGFALNAMIIGDEDAFKRVYESVKNVWLLQYYTSETYFLLACVIVFLLLNFKKVNGLLISITIFYLLGSLCYIYLFSYQFMDHDYYFIAIMPFFFFLMLSFGDCLNKFSLRFSRGILFIFFVIMFFNFKESILKCKENYFFRFDSKIYLGGQDLRPYYDLGPRLNALGIGRNDKIASAFDDTFSCSLYLMGHAGFTIPKSATKEQISATLNTHAVKYLLVNDSAAFNKVYPNALAEKIVLTHRGLILYSLK